MTSKVRSSSRGFSLVELLVVITVIGIIAAIAIPALQYALLRSRAARIVTDFNHFRTSLASYHVETGDWPADTASAIEPSELAPYLEGKLGWVHNGFTYEWENWVQPDGTALHPETGVRYGFSVRTDDPVLHSMVLAAWEGPIRSTVGYGLTFIIEGVGSGGNGGGGTGSGNSSDGSEGSDPEGNGNGSDGTGADGNDPGGNGNGNNGNGNGNGGGDGSNAGGNGNGAGGNGNGNNGNGNGNGGGDGSNAGGNGKGKGKNSP